MGYDIFTLSNPKELINSINTIKLSDEAKQKATLDLESSTLVAVRITP